MGNRSIDQANQGGASTSLHYPPSVGVAEEAFISWPPRVHAGCACRSATPCSVLARLPCFPGRWCVVYVIDDTSGNLSNHAHAIAKCRRKCCLVEMLSKSFHSIGLDITYGSALRRDERPQLMDPFTEPLLQLRQNIGSIVSVRILG